jgi:hypothetical protein
MRQFLRRNFLENFEIYNCQLPSNVHRFQFQERSGLNSHGIFLTFVFSVTAWWATFSSVSTWNFNEISSKFTVWKAKPTEYRLDLESENLVSFLVEICSINPDFNSHSPEFSPKIPEISYRPWIHRTYSKFRGDLPPNPKIPIRKISLVNRFFWAIELSIWVQNSYLAYFFSLFFSLPKLRDICFLFPWNFSEISRKIQLLSMWWGDFRAIFRDVNPIWVLH